MQETSQKLTKQTKPTSPRARLALRVLLPRIQKRAFFHTVNARTLGRTQHHDIASMLCARVEQQLYIYIYYINNIVCLSAWRDVELETRLRDNHYYNHYTHRTTAIALNESRETAAQQQPRTTSRSINYRRASVCKKAHGLAPPHAHIRTYVQTYTIIQSHKSLRRNVVARSRENGIYST